MTALAKQLIWVRDLQKGRKHIKSLKELDEIFHLVEESFKISNDTGMTALDRFRYVPKLAIPKDPYSAEYKKVQDELYFEISNKSSYDSALCEQSPFDFESAKIRPYPYATGSGAQVGAQLIAQGSLLKGLNLQPEASIVEFGAGWGNLTLALAQTGFDVTAVEIGKQFCDLLAYRSNLLKLPLNIIQTDMLSFEASKPYDAAIFFESFHHCSDHKALLKRLHKIIKPTGKIFFVGEPITIFSQPWGLRLDGQSLWVIRKHGWLELGFDVQYFKKVLRDCGWRASAPSGWLSKSSDIWIASRL